MALAACDLLQLMQLMQLMHHVSERPWWHSPRASPSPGGALPFGSSGRILATAAPSTVAREAYGGAAVMADAAQSVAAAMAPCNGDIPRLLSMGDLMLQQTRSMELVELADVLVEVL